MSDTRDAMTLVAELFAAVNHGLCDDVIDFYADDCDVELAFSHSERARGRAEIDAAWRHEFSAYIGALPGGLRYSVHRIAGIETGWGWVRADWARALRNRASGAESHERGYSYFWIEEGKICRQRSITEGPAAREATAAIPSAQTAAVQSTPVPCGRRYPAKPVVGVGGIVFNDAGDVLLVKRKHEPLAQQWSLPGGGLDVGETLEAGTAREIKEETGLEVEVGPMVEAFDRILLDDAGQVSYHFVLVDYLCRCVGGELMAASDASACAWVPVAQLSDYPMAEKPRDVIAKAVVMRRAMTTGDTEVAGPIR